MKRRLENVAEDKRKRKCINSECESASVLPEEGELGVIEQVSVTNFMCHENLTLNFEPHLNFIIGRNGSGKSAVLTAIMLALGGKSSSTDRFTNTKGFVKRGKNKAKVEIVLRNRGALAYKPEEYGEKIAVIREFNKDGISSYKIKSESGTICSIQKSELNEIMERMDIMVECPVCVLTQATSKRFLISKDAKAERLFEFFYKATGLEILEEMYKSMTISKEEAEAEIDKKKQIIPDIEKDIKKWKKYITSSERISDFENELIWANVITMEKEVQEKENDYKKMEEEFEEHKRELERFKKSFAEKSSELDEFNKQKCELVTEMENNRKELEECKAEHEVLASQRRRSRGTLQRLKNLRTKFEEDITGLEKRINEENRRDQRSVEEEDKKRKEAIEKLQNDITSLDNKYKNTTETINTTRSEQNDIEKSIENFRDKVNQQKYLLQGIEQNLIAARKTLKSKDNAFGEHNEKILSDIRSMQQRNMFREEPIGPIGKYLEVKDLKWAATVEFATSGGLLNSFCVDNHQDAQLLRGILENHYVKPPTIIVSRYEKQMFDVTHGRVQSQYPSVLDMLEIKHPQVANSLIDQAQIEKKILVEDELAGVNIMRNPPRNCHSAYFINCDQICFNPSRLYSYGRRSQRSSRLSAIGTEDLKNLEKDREEKKSMIEQLMKQINTMENAKKSLPGKIENLKLEAVEIHTNRQNKLMGIKELECKEDTKDVNCLYEELHPLYCSYEQKKEEIEQESQVLSELESKKHDMERKIDTLSTQLKSLGEDFERLLMEISNVSKLKENFVHEKIKFDTELKYKENRRKTHHNSLEDLQSKLHLMLASAESTCPRINTERSSEDISRLIKETKRAVEEQSNCAGDNLIKKYKEKEEHLRKAKRDLKRIEHYLVRIGDMLKVRNANFQNIRKNTELLIDLTFTAILSKNGFTGRLLFDHTNRNLTMDVSTRASDRTRKNPSSLSGGERSFVTIAFLLALWERTKMPFRILDEYDVFMDSKNRKRSIGLIIDKCLEMPKTQFILLSPLELTNLPEPDYIHILKLAAPKRKGKDENSPRETRS